MEDVLDLYAEDSSPEQPVVCDGDLRWRVVMASCDGELPSQIVWMREIFTNVGIA